MSPCFTSVTIWRFLAISLSLNPAICLEALWEREEIIRTEERNNTNVTHFNNVGVQHQF